MKHIWTIVCSHSVIDSESNNISLNNVLEKITFTMPKAEYKKVEEAGAKGPLLAHNFEIISLFSRDLIEETDSFFYRISMVNPSGETMIQNTEQEARLDKNMRNMRIRSRFDTLPMEGTGIYGFKIETKQSSDGKYKEVYTAPIELVLNIQ